MNKERKVIEPNAIIVFDRNVKASELNLIAKDFNGDVIITKKLMIDSDLNIEYNLHVISDIMCRSKMFEHNINIKGDLYCYGKISCHDINVWQNFYCEDIIYSTDIKVGGDMCSNNTIHAYGHKIVVAGNLNCEGIVAEDVAVLGRLNIQGTISASKSIKIGY